MAMFSWITGTRIANAIEDQQNDPAYDTTFIEGPETPAHEFVGKAFKQALFGTPAPRNAHADKNPEKKTRADAANTKAIDLPAVKEDVTPISPSKQPNGILMTPGTANKGRKTVSFGAQVVDNEGKKGILGKSGIPNDCPGKFPSPWTPGTALIEEEGDDKRPRTKLTAALYDARSMVKPRLERMPRSKDDNDVTMDLSAPRSESGKYWKEQYDMYAERSQKEMRQLVTKQQVAKNYAKKKDGEAIEALTKLEEARRQFRNREHHLETQNRDLQEQLRKAKSEHLSASVEISALKSRLEALEKSLVAPSSELQNSKASFQIFEDSSKDLSHLQAQQEKISAARVYNFNEPPSVLLGKPIPSLRMSTASKEHSYPRPRHRRRQTVPDASSHDLEIPAVSTLSSQPPELSTTSPYRAHQTKASKENIPPMPHTAPASSPFVPHPSSDPWMAVNNNNSSVYDWDPMALPISSAPSLGKSKREAHSTSAPRHRVSKSVPHAPKNDGSKGIESAVEKAGPRDLESETTKPAAEEKSFIQDSKFDIARSATHHAEGSSLVTRDRVKLPVDRKELAKRRIEERNRLKRSRVV